MKRILTMLVVTSLLASPALAFAGPNDPEKPKVDLRAAAKVAAAEIVAGEGNPLAPATAAAQEVNKGKLWTGIAMIVVGAGVIYKGIDLYDSDPDPFGRKKNADAYLAMGVGSVIGFFGALVVRGGLAGRGFN